MKKVGKGKVFFAHGQNEKSKSKKKNFFGSGNVRQKSFPSNCLQIVGFSDAGSEKWKNKKEKFFRSIILDFFPTGIQKWKK